MTNMLMTLLVSTRMHGMQLFLESLMHVENVLIFN